MDIPNHGINAERNKSVLGEYFLSKQNDLGSIRQYVSILSLYKKKGSIK